MSTILIALGAGAFLLAGLAIYVLIESASRAWRLARQAQVTVSEAS